MYRIQDTSGPVRVVRTAWFASWLRRLRDPRAAAAIIVRIRRLEMGHSGDWKPVGGPLRELRVDIGPGYRVYLATIDHSTVVLLGGGSKSTQARDIARARTTLRNLT
jgi:putative addiction module killer protein